MTKKEKEIDWEQFIKEQRGCGKYVGTYRCGTVIFCAECVMMRTLVEKLEKIFP